MYQTSENYKVKIYQPSTRHLLKIYINNKEIDSKYILDYKSSNSLFSNDEFSLGSVVSQSVEIKLYKTAVPETISKIYIESGIANEVVPIGYFNLEEISKDDDYTVNLKLFDNMIKFEFNYDGSEIIENEESTKIIDVLQDICNKAGVELGSTSFLNMNQEVAVYDNSISARTYLSYIAEQAGGFACIGRDGKLYIKYIGENTSELNSKYLQNFKLGEKFKISRVYYEDGVQTFEKGENSQNTLYIKQENMYIVNQEQIDNIFNKINGLEAYSFEGDSIIDPSLDVGDLLIIDGKKIIYQGSIAYVGKFKANISSKIQCSSKQETTTKTTSQTVINRRVQSEINQIDGNIRNLVEKTEEIEQIANGQSVEINNNYNEIIQKLGDYATQADIITVKNSVETVTSSTEYAINVVEDIKLNGISKVKTSTNYTFDENGLSISKDGAKTKSILNEIGLRIEDNTGSSKESLLFAGYDEETGETLVKSKNMTIEKYLVIGKYSRIEDYDNNGTGIFWIGG